MAFTIKAPDGLVPAAEAAIYTCPAATTALLNGRFVNKAAAAKLLVLKRKLSGGTARFMDESGGVSLDPGKPYFLPRGLTLEASGELRASDGDGAAIEYTLNVVEKT